MMLSPDKDSITDAKHRSKVSANYLCRNCHFNLSGLMVETEPKYDLHIIRCPKCNAVNPTDSFPYSGSATGHIKQAVSILWLITLLSLIFIVAITISVNCEYTSNRCADKLINIMSQDFDTYLIQKYPEEIKKNNQIWKLRNEKFSEWWQVVGEDNYIVKKGGWFKLFEWNALLRQQEIYLSIFCMGVFVSLFFSHYSKRKFILLGLAMLIIPLSILFTGYFVSMGNMYDLSIYLFAKLYILPSAILLSVLITTFFFALGLLLGHPITHHMSQVLLSPERYKYISSVWVKQN